MEERIYRKKAMRRWLREFSVKTGLQAFWKKYVGLPSPKELGRSKYDALPMAMSQEFPDDVIRKHEYTWDDYDKEMKELHPLRYFINVTIPDAYHFCTSYFKPIGRAIYWLKCHVLKKHRYHMIDIRQPKYSSYPYTYGYIDPVDKMLLANFAILVEFVEKEEPYNPRNTFSEEEINRNGLREQQDRYDEVMILYNWWKTGRKEHLAGIEERYNLSKEAKMRGQYDKAIQDWISAREDFNEVEDDMIIRLAKIRRYLWT